MRKAIWYFDFISPYAYLQFKQLHRLPKDLELEFRPLLFAGLLNHWGQLGPAEIPWKRANTFLLIRWRARQLGLPYQPPPRHPFNPLALLRLSIALDNRPEVIETIYDHVWAQGEDGQSEESLKRLANKLGLDDLATVTSSDSVKAQLWKNGKAAIADGVFGVPSFVIDGKVFWGDDLFEFFLEWLENPNLLAPGELEALAHAPAASDRRKP